MQIKTAIDALKALSQDTRMRVFRLLVQAGCSGMPAGRIALALDVNQTTLSRHLAMLEQAGLLMKERSGQQIIYRVDFSAIRGLIGFLMEDCCAGDSRVVPNVVVKELEGVT